ncbi:ABC-type transport system, ATPase component [Parascardovia denticolens IPLA 20019]|nr:ABC-type transport system, ATPase component [Parascardovia denticolens IPLA 20019]
MALIRNLLFPPQILLLDEVTTGLDEASRGIVHQLIDSVKKDGVTIVQVTHDAQELEEAGRIIHIVEGRVEE